MRYNLNSLLESSKESLVGETITHIDVDESQSEILFTTQSGKQILVHHWQQCCEEVKLAGIDGDIYSLVGWVARDISEETEEGKSGDGTWTKTVLTFRVGGLAVVTRWFGESNGYYSENVDFSLVVGERLQVERSEDRDEGELRSGSYGEDLI